MLHGLGATPTTPITILSDGADGPRSLGEAASLGPTHHVLDWFHLSMRIQHVAQTANGWPDASVGDRRTGADLADAMGTTVAAVYRLHSRANQLLRECMSKETEAWTRT